jgi:hypothetical protein
MRERRGEIRGLCILMQTRKANLLSKTPDRKSGRARVWEGFVWLTRLLGLERFCTMDVLPTSRYARYGAPPVVVPPQQPLKFSPADARSRYDSSNKRWALPAPTGLPRSACLRGRSYRIPCVAYLPPVCTQVYPGSHLEKGETL